MFDTFTFDRALELKDAGLVAASAAATVGGNAQVLDFKTGGAFAGVLVADVSAIEVATGDEIYTLVWELSNDNFAAETVRSVRLALGAATPTGNTAASGTGRYAVPVSNEFHGTVYRYARLYIIVAGTIATGINARAFVAPIFVP